MSNLEIFLPAAPARLTLSRRSLLAGAASLLLPGALAARLARADESTTPSVITDLHEDEEALWWDGTRQIVVAYQRGEVMGEPCRQLDEHQAELPVKLQWRMPPKWVAKFPTIQFKTSNGQWEIYEGWSEVKAFVERYEQFNPPERTDHDVSPFKKFVQEYDAPRWTWPGKITDHLLDPNGPHRFSEYELRGLKTSEKKKLHTAHHNQVIAPGRKAPKLS